MKRLFFILLVFAVSCSCMIYELTMAQIFSALLGNTLLRYSLTIGLYLASLGMGSLLISARATNAMRSRLFWTEIALALLGGLGPALLIVFDSELHRHFDPAVAAAATATMGWMYPVLLGMISGMELPLLIHLGERVRFTSGRVLGLDYFGTMFGVAAFAFYLLPGHGVLAAPLVAACLTAFSAAVTLWIFPSEGPEGGRWASLAGVFVILISLSLVFEPFSARLGELYATVPPP